MTKEMDMSTVCHSSWSECKIERLHVYYYQPRVCIRVSKRIHRTIDKDCGNCAFDKTRDQFLGAHWIIGCEMTSQIHR